jgi:hypothetical protein
MWEHNRIVRVLFPQSKYFTPYTKESFYDPQTPSRGGGDIAVYNISQYRNGGNSGELSTTREATICADTW